jgi:hypothetical protein
MQSYLISTVASRPLHAGTCGSEDGAFVLLGPGFSISLSRSNRSETQSSLLQLSGPTSAISSGVGTGGS